MEIKLGIEITHLVHVDHEFHHIRQTVPWNQINTDQSNT
jgi:hypothetical protein